MGRVHLPVPLAGTGATFNVPTGRVHLLVPLAGTCATFNVLTGRVHLPLSQPVGYNFHVQKVRVRGQGRLSCPNALRATFVSQGNFGGSSHIHTHPVTSVHRRWSLGPVWPVMFSVVVVTIPPTNGGLQPGLTRPGHSQCCYSHYAPTNDALQPSLTSPGQHYIGSPSGRTVVNK